MEPLKRLHLFFFLAQGVQHERTGKLAIKKVTLRDLNHTH
jgi:hypothetical protein